CDARRSLCAHAARRLRHGDRRGGFERQRGREAVDHDRPRLPCRARRPHPGRGHQLRRHAHGGPHSEGDAVAPSGPDQLRHRAPALDHPRRRPDPGHGGRPDPRAGHSRRAHRGRRRLCAALRGAVRGRSGRGGLKAGGAASGRHCIQLHLFAPVNAVARYSCTIRMAMEPSPTADATRLTEPCLTSPTANSPGMLVSNRRGGRSWVQCSATSGPVRIKPHASRLTDSGSHSVNGSPPMSTKRPAAWTRSRCPEPRSRSSTYCKRPDPPPPATSVPWRTSTFRVLLISRIRYSDMLVSSDSERTSIVTRSAYFARCRAAWPAELPPPPRTHVSRSPPAPPLSP